jgi:hypothetical protein
MAKLPETVIECDGCEEDLNILAPYLFVTVKAQREALIMDESASADPNEVPTAEVLLGTKSGRGVMLRFHRFDCLAAWVAERKGLEAKIEYHSEDEIYEPADNRSPEELVKDGDMHPALAEAIAEMAEPEEEN